MSKYKCCSACDSNPRVKGAPPGDLDWPEELPYRKKGKGKKYCKKNKGAHVYDTWTDWFTYTRYRYRYQACKCGKRGWGGYQSQSLVEYTYIIDGEEIKRSHWT